jgi:hypothetical protein
MIKQTMPQWVNSFLSKRSKSFALIWRSPNITKMYRFLNKKKLRQPIDL